ncbi:hypothetical protein UY3_12822 [Chelonia mydas]|uniref:Uncharacterized protein n=1 Tax=Chelonia mydas TaxID=8469 RepID=M7AZ62_CHEMY|nr:hypothetical protein UY3_12822 [Chelonia mydas]
MLRGGLPDQALHKAQPCCSYSLEQGLERGLPRTDKTDEKVGFDLVWATSPGNSLQVKVSRYAPVRCTGKSWCAVPEWIGFPKCNLKGLRLPAAAGAPNPLNCCQSPKGCTSTGLETPTPQAQVPQTQVYNALLTQTVVPSTGTESRETVSRMLSMLLLQAPRQSGGGESSQTGIQKVTRWVGEGEEKLQEPKEEQRGRRT